MKKNKVKNGDKNLQLFASLNMNFISEESPIFADSENIISHF